jgi:hypothetical protein
MPLTLVGRSGSDTLSKLEAAAVLRMREAERLYLAGQRLGAIYLYGYVIEISLKTAYYRVIGLTSATLIDPRLHRFAAEKVIRAMAALPAHPQGPPMAGHHLIGWARLLSQVRALPVPGRSPLDAAIATELLKQMRDVFNCWAEFLRYRANRPYNEEVQKMRETAKWIRRNYRKLWS